MSKPARRFAGLVLLMCIVVTCVFVLWFRHLWLGKPQYQIAWPLDLAAQKEFNLRAELPKAGHYSSTRFFWVPMIQTK